MSDLIKTLDAVKDERSFIAFLDALASDHRNHPTTWQWHKIEEFLESCSAWAEDSKGGLKDYPLPDNSWKRSADILFAGKIYE